MTELPTPQTVVTLRAADDRDRTLWVTEDMQTIFRRMNDADISPGDKVNSRRGMVRLTRWRAMSTSDYWTRTDNIANLEPYS